MTKHTAFHDRECSDCGTTTLEGDPIFFSDGGALCSGCGIAAGVACDCGAQKRLQFDTCWDCRTAAQPPSAKFGNQKTKLQTSPRKPTVRCGTFQTWKKGN